MQAKKLRTIALATLVVSALASSLPVLSASRAGTLDVTRVGDGDGLFVSGEVPIEWAWQTGTMIKSTSVLDVRAVNADTGELVMRKFRYARWGSWTWNTTNGSTPDGTYAVSVSLRNEPSIASVVLPVFVDNTAPSFVRITKPSSASTGVTANGEELGGDVTSGIRVVAGTAVLEAEALDVFSGIAEVAWYLDRDLGQDANGIKLETVPEEGSSQGTTFRSTADFSTVEAGEHTLTAVAIDQAGNATDSAAVDIRVVTAPSAGPPEGVETPDPGDVVPSGDPSPLPSPSPSGLPNPEDVIPSGDPNVEDLVPGADEVLPDEGEEPSVPPVEPPPLG